MERTKIPGQPFGLPDIGIPFEVLFHPGLNNTEKILYGFIRNLSHSEKGCYATNAWLAGLLGVGKQTITNSISNMDKWGVVIVKQDEETDVRRIYINAEYTDIYNKFLSKKGYKDINRGVLEKLYPSIKNLIGSYPLTYSKSILEDVRKDARLTTFKNFILQEVPEQWRENIDLLKSINDWLLVRYEKKSANPTKRACELTGRDLAKYSLEVATEALKVAAKNSWTGVFPDKIKPEDIKHVREEVASRSPHEIISTYFNNSSYGKKFIQYYDVAEHTLTNHSNGQGPVLAKNMLTMRKEIRRKQTARALENMAIPASGEIVFRYASWLGEQTWMDNVDAKTYTEEHALFKKFVRMLSDEVGVDIYDGSRVV